MQRDIENIFGYAVSIHALAKRATISLGMLKLKQVRGRGLKRSHGVGHRPQVRRRPLREGVD